MELFKETDLLLAMILGHLSYLLTLSPKNRTIELAI